MKKNVIPSYNFIISDDYKLADIEMDIMSNFESTERWLYLGADAANPDFARIGITMRDLRSRSYSSANPNYYLFCAFKCIHNLPVVNLKSMESDVLREFENYYRDQNGLTKRAKFYESDVFSDCFYNIDFEDFLRHLHYFLYTNYRQNFVISAMDYGFGVVDGEFIDCIFNQKVKNQNRYRQMLIQ